MCRMWWPLTLTYIFKVIRPWLWKSCPLCNVFSSRSIIFFTWDPIWPNSVGNHEAAGGYPQNAGVLVVLVFFVSMTEKIKFQDNMHWLYCMYSQISNISCSLVGIELGDHSDIVGPLPVRTAPTTSSFPTLLLVPMDGVNTTARQDENHLFSGIWCPLH